jgi:hypothetical protein
VTGFKILFDSNAFYACEDISPLRQHQNAHIATRLKELALGFGCELFLSPATKRDIDRAPSSELRAATHLKRRQWKMLADPHRRVDLRERADYRLPLSDRDAVDLEMIAALDSNAVDFLITEDRRLREHAAAAGHGQKVLSLLAAIEYLQRLIGEPVALPTLEKKRTYEISVDDHIFDSVRADYSSFNVWFAGTQQQHRDCLVVTGYTEGLEGIAILKLEEDRPYNIPGKVLKVCTFKVAESALGAKRGELLLKGVFNFAEESDADQIYVEVLPQHDDVVQLFSLFGFKPLDLLSDKGEQVLVKNRRPPPDSSTIDAFTYHCDYGPPAIVVRTAFIVPIRPHWHDTLFPECRLQGQLIGPDPSGNALLKAYLCRSNITTIERGDTLFFYRSHDLHSVSVVGVVEKAFRFDDPTELRSFVGLRTVYTDEEIRSLCEPTGSVLAILFRQDRVLPRPWSLQELEMNGVVAAAPQAIQTVAEEGALNWIRTQLNASH